MKQNHFQGERSSLYGIHNVTAFIKKNGSLIILLLVLFFLCKPDIPRSPERFKEEFFAGVVELVKHDKKYTEEITQMLGPPLLARIITNLENEKNSSE